MNYFRPIIGCLIFVLVLSVFIGGCASNNLNRKKRTVLFHGTSSVAHGGTANHGISVGNTITAATGQTEEVPANNGTSPIKPLFDFFEHKNIERQDHDQHEHKPGTSVSQNAHPQFIPIHYPEPFGFSLSKHWLDPWLHSHFSRRGTPFTHFFNIEPAFLDRDFFLDTRFIRGEEENEFEVEAELEWALTRRIGLVLEGPFRVLDSSDGNNEEGMGDIAIAPRFLMVDTKRFLLSLNLELEIPTGSERRGLGRGETALSPTLSWWYDLGKWVAWSGQVGTEHGLESGEDELIYKTGLTYSLLGPALFEESHAAEHEHGDSHIPPGMVNFITEFTGKTGLRGGERGRSTGEFLFGISYMVTSNWETRMALQFPLFKPKEFDNAYIFSLVYHF